MKKLPDWSFDTGPSQFGRISVRMSGFRSMAERVLVLVAAFVVASLAVRVVALAVRFCADLIVQVTR